MLHKQLLSALILGLLLTSLSPLSLDAQNETYKSVEEALLSRSRLSGSSGPNNVKWFDGGQRYSYQEFNSKTGHTEIHVFNPAEEEQQMIFSTEDVTYPDTSRNFNFRSYEWTDGGDHILFETNFRSVWRNSGISDYYLYSLDEQELQLVAEDAYTADLSPDGRYMGYERNKNLFVYDIKEDKEIQLTHTKDSLIYNGRYGWAYEEEFALVQAWKWSHDSNKIAFWRIDETNVPQYQMTDFSGQHPSYTTLRYPKVGDPNPQAKIGVVNIQDQQIEWMEEDEQKGEGYIPRIYWTADDNKLATVHLNRAQTHLELFFHNVNNGNAELVMEEQSDAWIDVYDFFAGIDDLFFFPKDRNQFFRISDRSGYTHIYHYNYEGEVISQVTNGEWDVTKINGVNYEDETIYYTSTEVDPLERHLYAINFDGSGKQKLTDEPGQHNIDMGSKGYYYIDRYSNTSTPKQVELRDNEGRLIKKLENNEAVNNFTENHFYAPAELFSFKTPNGRQLDAKIIKPMDFDSTKKYPLVLSVYGGPSAQSVYNEFETASWLQYLAQEGYVVAQVNNRGSGGYGKEFEKQVYKQLGKYEGRDFAATAEYLGKKSYIDSTRMAIYGHSYGGYMTTYTMVTQPDAFDVGIAAAPLIDWRFYDSIYAERYMGLLEDNKKGYKQSASTTHAGNLKGELLLVHSLMDENVHVQNTMQFVKALTDKGIDADLRIYPPGAHGVAYNRKSYILLHEVYTEHLNRYLK